ncbi:MAG: protein-tyrosine phosphatase family protein [Parachlamydiaceae bacterium]|nr:protein-tyrosine phosphatase family protein [Parachlamydiaceae bacterium]
MDSQIRPIESTVINEIIDKKKESESNEIKYALEILKNAKLDKVQSKALSQITARQIYLDACAIENDDDVRKIKLLKTAATIGNPDACNKMADIYFENEKYEEGYEYLKNAIKINPDHWESKYRLGDVFLQSDKDDERILGKKYLKEAAENGFAFAVQDSIKNAKDKCNFQKVVNLYSQENYNKSDEDFYELALILENHPEVQSNYNSRDLILTLSNKGHFRSILKLINHYIAQGNTTEAMEWCDKIEERTKLALFEKYELAVIYTSTLKSCKKYYDKGIAHLNDNLKNNHFESIKLLMQFDPELKKIKENEFYEKRLQLDAKLLDRIFVNVEYHPNAPGFRFGNVQCPKNTSINYPYLHANKVSLSNLHFIATQFPTEYQINHFISQCINQKNLIVNLTNINDKNKHQLEDYCEDFHDSINYSFEHTESKEMFNMILSGYIIKSKNDFNDKTFLRRLQYKGWPDRETPNSKELKNLVECVLGYENSENQRITVHCVAGSGRAATFIVACALYKYIQENKEGSITPETLLEVLKGLIIEVRTQRGKDSMNQEQIVFLFNWGRSLANNKI